MPDYRLIWFQHFHKAAGSSVTALARQNGETLYPNQRNANPYDEQERLIPLWELGDDARHAFIDNCEKKGVTFIASEWGAPDFVTLARDPRVVSITLLRDPWSRIVSNYTFDVLRRHERLMPIARYYNHHSYHHRQPNYYSKMLAAGRGVSRTQSVEELEKLAWENLSSIDFAMQLEATGSIDRLCQFLGWSKSIARENNKPGLIQGIRNQAKHGDAAYAYRRWRLDQPGWTGIDAFRAPFLEMNPVDSSIYRKLGEKPRGVAA